VKSVFAGAAIIALVASAQAETPLNKVPVHNKPTWQVITGMPESPGAAVPVRSLSTDQVLGAIPVDSRFLSFGSNGQIVTFGLNGELVYVPTSAVSALHPVPPKEAAPPGGKQTLEELAEAYEQKVTGAAAVSLELSDSLESKAQPIVGQGANPAMPGSNFMGGGAQPYNQYQPGAALMTGGPQALGGMANPYNGAGVPGAPPNI